MAFDSELAETISNTFRATIFLRLNNQQRSDFEYLLQSWLGIKNLRNVQLWTRQGAVTRNFINRGLGEVELDLRILIASKFINNAEPTFPIKTKCWFRPLDSSDAQNSFQYLTDNFVREYLTRIFFTEFSFCLEYAQDSGTPTTEIDLDSPEFEDLIED